MSDAGNKAAAIYGMILSTCEGRPRSANSLEELRHREGQWKDANPGLILLREAEPEVLLSFLIQSLDWLGEQRNDDIHTYLSTCGTITDGIGIALRRIGRLADEASLLQVLRGYRAGNLVTQMHFPVELFLGVLQPERVTSEIRKELRKLYPHFAPSPTGKIGLHTLEVRNRIAELLYVEGEKQLDPGRGPWSQIVFDELQTIEPIARAAWLGLLDHCQLLEQTVPSSKWKKRAGELMTALGQTQVCISLQRWLQLGPTPGQPSGSRAPIEDSKFQKGVVWCLSLGAQRESAVVIGDFGLACLRKIRMIGAVSQKVGFACVQALGEMECDEAISQLSRLRAKVRYTIALRLIEKSLRIAAERKGITTEELEDICVPSYELDHKGDYTMVVDKFRVAIRLGDEGHARVIWQDHTGKELKSVPAALRTEHPPEVRSVTSRVKEIEQTYQAQRLRLESSFIRPRILARDHWRSHFINHPLLGSLGRGLIWVFSNSAGWENSGIWKDGQVHDSHGKRINLDTVETVRLWHPLSSTLAEIGSWRERLPLLGIRQPFPQATREIYEITDSERESQLYSNRFAGKVLRQHQLASLCRQRGWSYRLMGAHFDGLNVPLRELSAWKMHAEFYVDLLPDRDASLHDSGFAEESAMGISVFVGSDQVRFYRNAKEIALDEVPVLVYSEVMRDVDLFTSVCSIGEDASWSDQGDRSQGTLTGKFDSEETAALIEHRADLLRRALPATQIADHCSIKEACLEVRGQLGTYRIVLLWGGVGLMGESFPQWITVPQKDLMAIPLDLGSLSVELDHRTELILRKALYFAEDWKITSPEVIKQLMPK